MKQNAARMTAVTAVALVVCGVWARGAVKLDDKATVPQPYDGATTRSNVALSWKPGPNAAEHDVYIGTDREAVANADTSSIRSGIYRGRQAATSYTDPPIRYPKS